MRGALLQRDLRAATLVGTTAAVAELAMVAAQTTYPWTLARWATAALGTVATDLIVAALFAVGGGLVLRSMGFATRDSGPNGVLAALVLCIPLMHPSISLLWAEGQSFGVAVLIASTLALVGGVGLCVRAITKPERQVLSEDDEVTWSRKPFPIALLSGVGFAAVVFAGGAAVIHVPVANATAQGPSVLLVTVDGLPVDQVPPALADLASGGAVFANAVTPLADVRGANTTVLVGLHPLRHNVINQGTPLSRAYLSVFEAFEAAGWATAAFVSSDALAAGAGLAQGFQHYDDAITAPHPALLSFFRRLWGTTATRPPADTAARFDEWLDAHDDAHDDAVSAWVHLGLYDESTAGAAAQLKLAIDGHPRPWVIAVVGTFGENTTGLSDAVVHVPLLLRWPGEPTVADVTAQVRLMDVAQTLLEAAGQEPLAQSEGVPLIGYATGTRRATLSCTLIGKNDAGAMMIGVRNNGVKVIFNGNRDPHLYLLQDDPRELHNRAGQHEVLVQQARGILEPDRRTLLRLVGE